MCLLPAVNKCLKIFNKQLTIFVFEMNGIELDIVSLSEAVEKCGGLQEVIDRNKWQRVAEILKLPKTVSSVKIK